MTWTSWAVFCGGLAQDADRCGRDAEPLEHRAAVDLLPGHLDLQFTQRGLLRRPAAPRVIQTSGAHP